MSEQQIDFEPLMSYPPSSGWYGESFIPGYHLPFDGSGADSGIVVRVMRRAYGNATTIVPIPHAHENIRQLISAWNNCVKINPEAIPDLIAACKLALFGLETDSTGQQMADAIHAIHAALAKANTPAPALPEAEVSHA